MVFSSHPDIPRMQSSCRAIIRNINQQPVLLGDPHLQGVFFFSSKRKCRYLPTRKTPPGPRLQAENEWPSLGHSLGGWNLIRLLPCSDPPTKRWLYLSKDGRTCSHLTNKNGAKNVFAVLFVFLVGLWRKYKPYLYKWYKSCTWWLDSLHFLYEKKLIIWSYLWFFFQMIRFDFNPIQKTLPIIKPPPSRLPLNKTTSSRFFKRIDAAPVVEATVDDKDTALTGEGIFFRRQNTRRVWNGFPPMVVV